MKTRKLAVVVGVALALAVAAFTVAFNRSLPSEREYELAKRLVGEVHRATSASDGQKAFFDVGHERVTLNVYGVTETATQEHVLARASENLAGQGFASMAFVDEHIPERSSRSPACARLTSRCFLRAAGSTRQEPKLDDRS